MEVGKEMALWEERSDADMLGIAAYSTTWEKVGRQNTAGCCAKEEGPLTLTFTVTESSAEDSSSFSTAFLFSAPILLLINKKQRISHLGSGPKIRNGIHTPPSGASRTKGLAQLFVGAC